MCVTRSYVIVMYNVVCNDGWTDQHIHGSTDGSTLASHWTIVK